MNQTPRQDVTLADGFQVIDEDESLLVIHKPPGVVTMGLRPPRVDLLTALRNYRIGKGEVPFVGMLGRLDAPVSGLIVAAKTPAAARQLTIQQGAGLVNKQYLAVVAGHVSTAQGELIDWLVSSKRHRRVHVVKSSSPGAQRAVLSYRVEDQSRQSTLLSVELQHTGRKHQIRAQWASRGHPIVGDRKYGSHDRHPHGIALVCHRIHIVHPTRCQPMEWQIDWDWQGLFDRS